MQFDFLQKTNFSIQDLTTYLSKEQNQFPLPLGNRTNLEEYAQKLGQKGEVVLAYDGKEIKGIIGGYCNDYVNRFGYISVLVVTSKYRGQGLGKVLLEHFIFLCESKSMKTIKVLTNAKNTAAIGLYKRFGFVQGTLNEADEYSMIKALEDEE